jgi:hypothetical protein
MSLDFRAMAVALAARFAAAQITPPSGYTNVRIATANPPNKLGGVFPQVVVFPEEGTFDYYPSKRDSGHDWTVRFYFSETQDIAREMVALESWLGVLADQLRISTQLGGTVTLAQITSWKIGVLEYAGKSYSGIELGVHIVANEGWAAVA